MIVDDDVPEQDDRTMSVAATIVFIIGVLVLVTCAWRAQSSSIPAPVILVIGIVAGLIIAQVIIAVNER